MKRNAHLTTVRLVLLPVLIGLVTTVLGQSWQTVDDSVLGTVRDIAFAPDGTGYSVVSTLTNNVTVTSVRRSRDSGATWQDASGTLNFYFRHLSAAAPMKGVKRGEAWRALFLFLKASWFSFPGFSFARSLRAAGRALPSLVPGRVPVTSSYSSSTARVRP